MANYTITVTQQTGGTVTAPATGASGTLIRFTVTFDTQYYYVYDWVCTGLVGKPEYNPNTGYYTFPMPSANVTLKPVYRASRYDITYVQQTGGTVTGPGWGAPGTNIQLTVTCNTGYELTGWAGNVTPSYNSSTGKYTFAHGYQEYTIKPVFGKISYALTKKASPTGGGTVTLSKSTANYNDQITVSQTPAAGYYFNGFTTSPTVTWTTAGSVFKMPASAVTITANYLKRSTATLSSKSMTGGGTVTLTISPDKTTYSHKYRLSFGTNMQTSLTSVAAGTTSVSISVPESWSNQIPSATSKGSGSLLLETYSGSTKIGEYTITGLTYNVPTTAKPTIGTITTGIIRTIGGTTYANVGSVYVQNKCGVRIQATGTGALSSTVNKIEVSLSGYTAAAYKTTVQAASVDFTTGLLNISGTITITVKATDTRGRTVTKTKDISVLAYAKPTGTLKVRRVDSGGEDDPLGTYAKYTKTSSFSAVGNNALTVTLKSQGSNASNPANSGNLLPSSRQTFDRLTEYTIQLVLADAFETVTISVKLPTAQFMIFVNAAGDAIGIMRATNDSLSKNGKTGTIQFSENHQMYVGSEMLEAWIRRMIYQRPLVQIPDNSDLDDYYEPGDYYVANSASSSTIEHIPVTGAGGGLKVINIYSTSTVSYRMQIYNAGGAVATYMRKSNQQGVWTAWHKFDLTAI